MMPNGKSALGVLVIAASVFTAQSVVAAQWDFQRKLRVQGDVTDNVLLTDDDPEGAGLFTLTPILSASTESKSSILFLEAAVDLEAYSNPENTLARPRLFAGIDSEPIPNVFTIDGSVQFRRSTLDEDSLLREFPNPEDDLVYVADYRLRPQVNVAFEDFANFEFDLRLAHEEFLEEGVRDETNAFFFTQLVHQPQSTGVYWALTTTASGFDASDDTDFSTIHGEVSLGYAFRNSWLFTVSGGRERFEEREILDSRFVEGEAVDNTWGVGLQWQPNELTTFNAGYERRVFGDAPFLSLKRDTRNGEFTLLWERVLAKAIGEGVGSLTDTLTGEPLDSAPGSGLVNDQLVNGLFAQDVFRLDYRLLGRLSEFKFGIAFTADEDESDFITGERFQFDTQYTRTVSDRSKVGVILSTDDRDNSINEGNYLRNRFAVFLETRF